MIENTAVDIREMNEIVNRESIFIEVIQRELSKKIVGQKNMVDKLMLALLAQGFQNLVSFAWQSDLGH